MSAENLVNFTYNPNITVGGNVVINTSEHDSIYHSLKNEEFMSIDEIMRIRKEMLEHKDNITELAEQQQDTKAKLEMYYVSEEEINEINLINEVVTNGKDKLLDYLKQYNVCIEKLAIIEGKIKDMKDTSFTVTQNLNKLLGLHVDFSTLTRNFLESLWGKKDELIEELQTEFSITCIERDRLGAIIMSLAKTYNILRNVPYTHKCPICLTNEVDTYLEPCGHTLCASCNQSNYCHMCRTRVKTSKGLYYS
jgi:hypothetical protein